MLATSGILIPLVGGPGILTPLSCNPGALDVVSVRRILAALPGCGKEVIEVKQC